jgi:hypothetical protein
VLRYTYPKYERQYNQDRKREEMVRVEVSGLGRPYVFKKEAFLTDEDGTVEVTPETLFTNEMLNGKQKEPVTTGGADDLPF